MKNFIYSTLLVAAVSFSATAAESGLSLQSRAALRQYRSEKIPVCNVQSKTLEAAGIPQSHVTGLIKLADGATAEELEAEGVNVVRVRGNIAMVSMPADDAERVAKLKSVKSMSLSRRYTKMDKVRDAIGVTKIHSGEDLPQAYTGKGVIAGIFDQGVDPNHINFRNEDGTSRISQLTHAYISSSSALGYRIDRYTADNISKFETDEKESFHGTHTTGIMAGSYRGTSTVAKGTSLLSAKVEEDNNPFYGIAYDAELVVSCGTLQDMLIALGIEDILDYAYDHQKPAVINLSLGSNISAHDGTETMCQYLDLAGKEAIICVSAGNEGDQPIALHKTFTAEDKELKTFIYPYGNLGSYYNLRYGQVYVYSNDATEFTIKMLVYNKSRGTITFSHTVSANMNGGAVYYSSPDYTQDGDLSNANFTKAFDGYVGIGSMTDENSGRYYAMIDFMTSDNQSSNADGNYILGFSVEGKEGQRIDCFGDGALNYMSNFGIEGWDDGMTDGTINDMACARNIITVGSYNTRNVWVSLDGKPYNYGGAFAPGRISSFSSYGTLIDGRQLPHLCAPGAAVISSSSTPHIEYNELGDASLQAKYEENGRVNYWHQSLGTSMAAPTVAGSVALWLEADPNLTIEDVQDIATSTAVKDSYVTDYTGDPVQWGAGKFDAYAGLKEVLRRAAGVGRVLENDNRLLMSNIGDRCYNLFLNGAEKMDVTFYNISGQPVLSQCAEGDEIIIDASHLTTGVYVMTVNGCHNQRILVK